MTRTPQDTFRDSLFDALDKERTGMLGVENAGQHMQPMTHFLDKGAESLWFISGKSTDLVQALTGAERIAHFTLTHKGGLYACMSGPLSLRDNPQKLDELWSPAASMWFDGGQDDPEVALIEMRLMEAAIWMQQAGALKFGLEMVRGALGDHNPDVGDHTVLNFPLAA